MSVKRVVSPGAIAASITADILVLKNNVMPGFISHGHNLLGLPVKIAGHN